MNNVYKTALATGTQAEPLLSAKTEADALLLPRHAASLTQGTA